MGTVTQIRTDLRALRGVGHSTIRRVEWERTGGSLSVGVTGTGSLTGSGTQQSRQLREAVPPQPAPSREHELAHQLARGGTPRRTQRRRLPRVRRASALAFKGHERTNWVTV
jgi:hypothetical protein